MHFLVSCWQQPASCASSSRISCPVHPVRPHVQPGHGIWQLTGIPRTRDGGQECKNSLKYFLTDCPILKDEILVQIILCVCISDRFQLDRFIPISKLKYYFAVDTMYVGKKLGLLVFPYMHEVRLL